MDERSATLLPSLIHAARGRTVARTASRVIRGSSCRIAAIGPARHRIPVHRVSPIAGSKRRPVPRRRRVVCGYPKTARIVVVAHYNRRDIYHRSALQRRSNFPLARDFRRNGRPRSLPCVRAREAEMAAPARGEFDSSVSRVTGGDSGSRPRVSKTGGRANEGRPLRCRGKGQRRGTAPTRTPAGPHAANRKHDTARRPVLIGASLPTSLLVSEFCRTCMKIRISWEVRRCPRACNSEKRQRLTTSTTKASY